MFKRICSVLLVTVLVLGLFAACTKNDTNKAMTLEEAKKLVCQDLSISEAYMSSMDDHITTINGAACYLIYITVNGNNWVYTVNSLTRQIVEKEESDHAHSH